MGAPTLPYHRVHNFYAGPSAIPLEVLERARDEFLNHGSTGMSVLEMSHRSTHFLNIIQKTQNSLRRLLNVPDNYAILFIPGGASLQFSMTGMNLHQPGSSMGIFHTGVWTGKAKNELEKIGPVHLLFDGEREGFTTLPEGKPLPIKNSHSFIYLCSNNTVYGTQWETFPRELSAPIVADMSSDICSRPIKVSDFGLIFAGAQKNLGPSGLTLVIIKKDLAERAPDHLPAMLDYRNYIRENSLYNTPPTFSIYLMGLVAEWIESRGGLTAMAEGNQAKAELLYQTIDHSRHFRCPVPPPYRSKMNVIFFFRHPDAKLEDRFLEMAKGEGLIGLKGHKTIGGFRASLYNAISLDQVKLLSDFLQTFDRSL